MLRDRRSRPAPDRADVHGHHAAPSLLAAPRLTGLDVLQLQRTAGNQAVSRAVRLLQRYPVRGPDASSTDNKYPDVKMKPHKASGGLEIHKRTEDRNHHLLRR